jgi:predicted MPP superfamily phosphohydrolase
MPPGPGGNVLFHSVYVTDQQWKDFRVLHLTDSHIAWRNDVIPEAIENVTSQPPTSYVNFNERFRNMIRYANRLHRRRLLDFAVITGDVVDFVEVDHQFTIGNLQSKVESVIPGAEVESPDYEIVDKNDVPADNNFEFFRDLVTRS